MSETTKTITLTADEAKAVDAAVKALRRADVEAAEARVKLERARLQQTELFDQLAETYDFDPSVSLRFDVRKRTIVFTEPGPPAG